jgi:hypothetical protein
MLRRLRALSTHVQGALQAGEAASLSQAAERSAAAGAASSSTSASSSFFTPSGVPFTRPRGYATATSKQQPMPENPFAKLPDTLNYYKENPTKVYTGFS